MDMLAEKCADSPIFLLEVESVGNRKISSVNSCATFSSPKSGHANDKVKRTKNSHCFICGHSSQFNNTFDNCCQNCRSFFRRCLLNYKEFTCKFEGECQFINGRRCRSCRFDACIVAGLDISCIEFPQGFDMIGLKRQLEEKRQTLLQQMQQVAQKSAKHAEITLTEGMAENIQSYSNMMELVEFNKCLEHLLLAEQKATKLRDSPNNLILEYLCGKSLADLIDSEMNALNFAGVFTMYGAPLKAPEEMDLDNEIHFIGNYLNLDTLLSIELMRTLPVCNGLSLENKLYLFQQNTFKLVTLSNGFYSHLLQAKTVTYPNKMQPANLCRNTLESTLNEEKFERYFNLRRRAFSDVVAEFGAINLSLEEFVLLRAAVFCNTVPEQCSANAKTALKAEAERYGRCLLRHLQLKLGDAAGARKYAECLLFATKIFDYSRRQAKFYQLLDREVFATKHYQQQQPMEFKQSYPPFVLECLLDVEEWRALFKLT